MTHLVDLQNLHQQQWEMKSRLPIPHTMGLPLAGGRKSTQACTKFKIYQKRKSSVTHKKKTINHMHQDLDLSNTRLAIHI